MRLADGLGLALGAVRAQRQRSALTALGIAVGIAAVVLLLSLGAGLQRYVLNEFTQFGTNLLNVTPGKTTTLGVSGAIINTVRPLTLGDAEACARIRGVDAVTPMLMGNGAVQAGERSRRVNVYGVGADMPEVWRFPVEIGSFLPHDDPTAARALACLGAKVCRELFADRNPLGELVRIGGERYRVIGVMGRKGQFLGIDLDDAVYLPVSRGLEMFDREGLMEIDVLCAASASADEVKAAVSRVIRGRHGGDDFTVTTQQQMLDVLGSVLSVLTFAVAALGGISLVVGAVGIVTIMTIALGERVAEIGLLRALGATRAHVLGLFLAEAAGLAALGGAFGLLLGVGVARLLGALVPALPVATTPSHAMLAEGVAMAIGLLAGVVPAIRAAHLDPVECLRAE